jgi:hypothetical protein
MALDSLHKEARGERSKETLEVESLCKGFPDRKFLVQPFPGVRRAKSLLNSADPAAS